MLVVIVVAAATAFSFFVAAYQKQLQSQEALQHDKSLEKLRVLSLEPTVASTGGDTPPDIRSLIVEIASLDVNTITVSGIVLSGNALIEYNVTNAAGTALAKSECLNGNPYGAMNASCDIALAPESQVFLQFDLNPKDAPTTAANHSYYSFLPATVVATLTQQSVLDFEILTSLGNEFTQAFVPPVAIAGITFVDSQPILDGSNSYQPAEGGVGNVSIVLWNWVVSSSTGCGSGTSDDCGDFSGQEYELPVPFTGGSSYEIALTVVNTESLDSGATISYELAAS